MSSPQPPLEPRAGGPEGSWGGPAQGPLEDPGSPAGPPEEAAPPVGPPEAAAHRSRRTVIEWAAILLIAVVAAVLLRTFVIQPYFIPSGSMEPTLKVGDKVLVNKLSYHMHSVQRGDVVVFKRPPNDYNPEIKDLIKRVIGLPDETISAQGGHVFIDGRQLKEPWLPKNVVTTNFSPVHIPAGDYFVMGDNRSNSADSRVIGPIAGNLIVGRAFMIVWPIGRIGTL